MRFRGPLPGYVLAAAVLAACTGGGGSAVTTSSTVAAPTTTERVDDGILLVGVVAPDVGAGVEIGTSVALAADLAAAEINAAGGVGGRRVRVVHRDEGDTASTAMLAVQDLVQLGVDLIIGPTSSRHLLGSLDSAVDAGVLTCAPTATALAIDDYPDRGLLLRTIPSDSLQAQALARLVDESGSASTVVVYLDDPYGRPFADAVRTALGAQGTTVAANVGFTGEQAGLSTAAGLVAALEPTSVVVVADSVTGPLVIDAIDEAMAERPPLYVVSDAIRRPNAPAVTFAGSLSDRIQGASPLAYADDIDFLTRLRELDDDATGLFAHNAYDCLNLVALASLATGSAVPSTLATGIAAVSDGGTSCSSFAVCAAALDAGRNIDYDGPSGELVVGSNGEVSRAVFERFGFDETGRDVGLGTLTIG